MRESVLNQKIEHYRDKFDNIQENFLKLIPQLEGFVRQPITSASVDEAQELVNTFLKENHLPITVHVVRAGDSLACIGNELVDQLIWEIIAEV